MVKAEVGDNIGRLHAYYQRGDQILYAPLVIELGGLNITLWRNIEGFINLSGIGE